MAVKRTRKRSLTIYDIARIAGVAPSQVSKTFNNTGDVSAETRKKIFKVIEKHKYHPSALGRGLSESRTENIGIVAVTPVSHAVFGNPHYSRIMEGIETEVLRRNYNLVFSGVPREERQLGLPKMVKERSVDGLILLSTMPEDFIRRIAELQLPMVMVDHHIKGLDIPRVLPDNLAGARQAVQHLAGLGHKDIGMVCGSREFFGFDARFRGFKEGIKEAGLKPGTMLVNPSFTDYDEDAWMLPILEKGRLPQAIFCCNDDHALRLLKLAAAKGLKCPRDFSLVGFDDIEAAQSGSPSLTTLRVNKQEMGSQAVLKLLEQIKNPSDKDDELLLPVALVARNSTRPAQR